MAGLKNKETNPGAYKDSGYVKSADCMRCSNCVVNCPKKALFLPAVPHIKIWLHLFPIS